MRSLRLTVLFAFAIFLTVGCAGVQQATIRAPVALDVMSSSPSGGDDATGPSSASSASRRLAFRSPHARVHVLCNDLINGDHHLEFRNARGRLLLSGNTGHGRLRVDVFMRDFRAESAFITSFAARMLETHAYPEATLDAKIEPIKDEPHTARLVTGNMTLHGVLRGIQFRADVTEENANANGDNDRVRLFAVFDLARSAFGIHATAADGEGIIRDDFTVTFDFRATKERVRVEEVDEDAREFD